MTDTQTAVLTERRDRVLVITINRPDQRNAVNAAKPKPKRATPISS